MAHMSQFTDVGLTGEEPLSNLDKYLSSEKARAILEHERDVRDRERFEYDAQQEKVARIKLEIADNEVEAASNERHPKPSAAIAKRCDATRVKLAAARAEASKGKGHSDSAANILDDFVKGLRRPTRAAETFAELPPVKTFKEMHDGEHSNLVKGRIHLKQAQGANAQREVIESRICAAVDKIAGRPLMASRRHEGEAITWPEKSYWNGRAFEKTIDTDKIMFDLFRDEIVAKLIARTIKDDFDDATGLTTMQRAAAIRLAEQEITRAEYLAEFWRREARKNGIVDLGPRITSNPLAILDIEYV